MLMALQGVRGACFWQSTGCCSGLQTPLLWQSAHMHCGEERCPAQEHADSPPTLQELKGLHPWQGAQCCSGLQTRPSVTISTAAMLWATVLLGQTAPLFTWQFLRV